MTHAQDCPYFTSGRQCTCGADVRDMHRLALGGSSAVSAQASEPRMPVILSWEQAALCSESIGRYLRARGDEILAAQAPQAPAGQDAERFRKVLEEIAAMTYDQWSNGAIAGRMAQGALDAARKAQEGKA